jgi:excisionase family DNA binding protein
MRKRTRKKPDEPRSETMTVREVADYLHCRHYFNVYWLVFQKALPGFRLGGSGHWRFRRSEIDQWIAARQVHPPPGAAEKPTGRGRRKPKA